METPKSTKLWVVVLLASTLLLLNVQAQAQLFEAPTPAYITFNEDTPGLPPAIGGINQPSGIFSPDDGTSAIVQDNVNGIDTRPVALDSDGEFGRGFVGPQVFIRPVSTGIVRYEATISFSRLVQTIFMRSSANRFFAPTITQLTSNGFGQIIARGQGGSGRLAALYEANKPFRVRKDIDLDNDTWAVTIDTELNGFEDDTTLTNLEYVNSPAVIPNLGTLFPGFSVLAGPTAGPAVMAVDDISVSVNGITVVPLDVTDKQINVCNKSPIKAAALGRPFFDTANIDPETVTLADASIRTVGKNEKLQVKVKDTDRDGNPDLEGKFVSQELGLTSEDEYAVLQAQTSGGDPEPVEGLDAVSVREIMCSTSAEEAFLDQE